MKIAGAWCSTILVRPNSFVPFIKLMGHLFGISHSIVYPAVCRVNV